MMPRILVLMILIAASTLAASDKPAQKKPKSAPAKVQAVTIPAGAVETEPYTYRYTDKEGKKWIYRKTPFGISRWEDKPPTVEESRKAQDEKSRLIDLTSAVEDGDSIRFERAWPFGKTSWSKKKTELNEVESAVWNREIAKRAGSETTSKD
jgi:hypothetical protein